MSNVSISRTDAGGPGEAGVELVARIDLAGYSDAVLGLFGLACLRQGPGALWLLDPLFVELKGRENSGQAGKVKQVCLIESRDRVEAAARALVQFFEAELAKTKDRVHAGDARGCLDLARKVLLLVTPAAAQGAVN